MEKIVFCLFAYDDGHSGISKYCEHSLDSLTQISDVTVISTYHNYFLFKKNYKGKAPSNIILFDIPFGLTGELLFHYFVLPFILFFQSYHRVIFPAANRRLCAFKVKNSIGVFHDLSQMHISNKYGKMRMLYIKYVIPMFLSSVSEIHCVSKNTKFDVEKYYGISGNRIKVNYNGFNLNRETDLHKLDIVLKRNVITYVSRLENPGKNHKTLIEAISKIPHAVRKNYSILFVGQDWGAKQYLIELIGYYGLQDNVQLLGHCSSKELEWVYSVTDIFVHPSLYEGFGFPLLEAMSRSIPCLCSNTGALKEVGGNAVISFDPKNSTILSKKLVRFVEDTHLQNSLIVKGQIRCREFSWLKHAQNLVYNGN